MLKRLAVLTLIITTTAISVEAKDLRQRLGVGIKNNTAFDLPAVAGVYYPSNELGITGSLGTDTKKDYSKFVISAGIRRIIFFEEHLNFYFGGQLAIVNEEIAATKESGWEMNALFGTEFFFAGLENLGWTFEGGAGVASMKDTRFRTIADHPLRAGIIFYF